MAMLNLLIQAHPSFFTHSKAKCALSSSSSRDLRMVPTPIKRAFLLKSACINNSITVVRRTANYHPCIWDFDFVQSLKNDYTDELYDRRAKKLVEYLRNLLIDGDMEWVASLELIDSVQRLGLGYLFEKEIKIALETIAFGEKTKIGTKEGLHAVALRFRLLRQHGYEISQDVFSSFMNKRGFYNESLCEDIKGMLSLYEASHLAFEGESYLDEARDFTIRHLKNIKKPIDPNLAKQVIHSLELPLQWRIPRLEARWYIDEHGDDIDPRLFDLAKLDFNMVQATHQDDLRKASRWWKNLGLGSKLCFARDRLVESFLWSVGVAPYPQFGTCREGITKLICMITTIDDVYDLYGTLDELKLFTHAVERWEIGTIEQLPDYMKMCFLALYDTINEMASDILTERGVNALPYLRKVWADLCKAYLVEANWYHNNYTPTLQEYLNNGWMSISAPVILVHAYFWVEKEITQEALSCLDQYSDIIVLSSTIFRIWDDLGTSTAELERGDVPKSIQCYMHESGVSENIAREHMRHLISDKWKKMNKDQILGSPFSQHFMEAIVNLARMAQCAYQYEDGYGVPNGKTKDVIMSLLVEPISLVPNKTC